MNTDTQNQDSVIQNTDELDNPVNLILSGLMIEVMRLRNTYKYDMVAPKAMNDEMDVAYHKAQKAIELYRHKQVIEELKKFKASYATDLSVDAYAALETRIAELRKTL